MDFDILEKQVLSLSTRDRAKLEQELLESLDRLGPDELRTMWLDEAERRVHSDIEADDIPAEVARLERWIVMQAPTGKRFCIERIQRPGFPKNANRWDQTRARFN